MSKNTKIVLNEEKDSDPGNIFYAVKNDSPLEIEGYLSKDPEALDTPDRVARRPLCTQSWEAI